MTLPIQRPEQPGGGLAAAAGALRRRRPRIGAGMPHGLALGRRGLTPGHLMQQGLPGGAPGAGGRFGAPGGGARLPVQGPEGGGSPVGAGTALPILAQFLRKLGGPSAGAGLPFQRPR